VLRLGARSSARSARARVRAEEGKGCPRTRARLWHRRQLGGDHRRALAQSLGKLDGLRGRVRPAGEHFVRELDSRRRENLVRQPHRESPRLAFVTRSAARRSSVHAWSTLPNGIPEIPCNYRERDTGFEDAEPPSISRTSVASRPNATVVDIDALAIEFLTAVRSGDDRAVGLASRLAEVVLDASSGRLALTVLEGGALTITRAIRLAEHVLSVSAPTEPRREGAS
jgi:hypothetical protein